MCEETLKRTLLFNDLFNPYSLSLSLSLLLLKNNIYIWYNHTKSLKKFRTIVPNKLLFLWGCSSGFV